MGDDSTAERRGWGWLCSVRPQNKSSCEPKPGSGPDIGTENEDDTQEHSISGKIDLNSQHETGDGPADQLAPVPTNADKRQPKHYWRSAVDPVRGVTYYYHKKTKATIWEKPIEMEDDEPASGNASNCNTETKATSLEHDIAEGQLMKQGMKQEGAISANSAHQKAKNYWRTAVDPVRGIPYYYHKKTKETRWEKPVKMEEQEKRKDRQ